MPTRIQLRRGSAEQWTTANPVLADGEQGYETDTGRLKVGNGVTPWTVLEYLSTIGGGGGAAGGGAAGGAIQFVLDNDGTELATGTALDIEIPFATILTRVTLLADQEGSVELDLLADPFNSYPPTTSIVASSPPAISTAQAYRDTDLTGWTKTLNAGDVLRVNVESVTDITRLTVCLSAIAPEEDPEVPGSVYEDVILNTSGLAAYWKMGEESEPLNDHMGLRPFTTMGGGTVELAQPSLVASDTGGASAKVSDGSYFRTDHDGIFNQTDDFAIECWARPTWLSPVVQTVIGKASGVPSSSRQYRLNILGSGEWRATVYASGGTAHVVGPTASTSIASHVAMVVSSGNLYLWVNGTMYGPTPISGTINTTTGPFQVAAFSGLEPVNMFVDEVAFYTEALTEQTLTEHYLAGRGGG